MELEEQEALLGLWIAFLDHRPPSAPLMREFYFGDVSRSQYYRYGMAAEVFDLLINGPFEPGSSRLWARSYRAAGGHRAA